MKRSASVSMRCARGLAASLTAFATLSFGAPPVLVWNDAMETNVWNATETNWVDQGSQFVAWQPGAEALFAGSGATIQLEADVSATNLTFTGSGYTLLGAGRLTVEGTLAAAAATVNSIAADLRSAAGLAKTGAGTLTLSGPSAPMMGSTSAAAITGYSRFCLA